MKKLIILVLVFFSTAAFGQFIVDISRQKAAYLSAVSTLLPVSNGSSSVNTTIPLGSSALLTWDSVRANSCTGTGFSTGGRHFGTVTVSPAATTTYTVTCDGKPASAIVNVVGNLIDAAVTYCASNGGGDGSSGTPWQDRCISAAVAAASNNDTVYLGPGNWALNTSVATFTGTIASGQLTVSGVTGTIAIGQTINGNNIAFSFVPSDFPVITGTCGANCWTLNHGPGGSPTYPLAMNSGYPIFVTKNINIVGAGSGNTYDVYGHPSNGFTPSKSNFLATVTPAGSITRVYMTGPTYTRTGAGGYFQLYGGSGSTGTGEIFSNIFVDGSEGYNGGGPTGVLVLNQCAGCMIDRLRVWGAPASGLGETQLAINNSTNVIRQNSVIAEDPELISGGTFYTNAEVSQDQADSNTLYDNNLLYQLSNNPITMDYLTIQREADYNIQDSLGRSQWNPEVQATACPLGVNCPTNSGTNGDFGFYVFNSYFQAGGYSFGAGGGVDDPGGSGQLNDIRLIGNWMFGNKVTIAGCAQSIFSFCASGVGSSSGSGMAINGPSPPLNQLFTSTNNSLIANGASNAAVLNATGTGIGYSFGVYGASFTGRVDNGTPGNAGTTLTVSSVASGSLAVGQFFGGAGVTPNSQITGGSGTVWTITPSQSVASEAMVAGHNNLVYGFNSTKNYLSSASNQYLTDANGVSPIQTGNYCTPAAGSVSGCATSGFNILPTVSFTLGTLSGSTIQFANENWTAQFGAVQWIASTSSKTPTSADSRWGNDNASGAGGVSGGNSYIPPVSLSGILHGDTVYMWVMDSANNISVAASVVVP